MLAMLQAIRYILYIRVFSINNFIITMKDIVFIKTNKYYTREHVPKVTIITSNYNRRELLLRCMRSVDAQTFKDIEYIVVDNGSSVSFDDIMEQFMAVATIPVMFIKRSNGTGRHTGRNSAIEKARGEYLCMIDSDDTYLPHAMETLVNAWNAIPEEHRLEYREVVAQCQDEYGNRCGSPFPDGINDVSINEAFKIVQRPELGYEHANMSRTILLKENPFLDPEGVDDSAETIIWWRLAKKYKSFFINDIVRTYFTESGDSITNLYKNGLTKSACISSLWREQYYLNHWDDFLFPFKERVKKVVYYTVWKNALNTHCVYPPYNWAKEGLKGFTNNVLAALLYLPGIFITKWYFRHHEDLINK